MVSGTSDLIRLADPDLSAEDINRAVESLQSGQLVQGEAVERFEADLSAFTGVEAVVVSSGTAALHCALLALDVGPGDAVLVPAFTFPATANVVELVGARTILCDVDPRSYVVTPGQIDAALRRHAGEGVRLVMPVSEFGCPVDTPAMVDLATPRGVHVVEDAACAMGTSCNGKHPGHAGDAACLSFHPRKAITTGDGGAVLSHRRDVLDRVRRLRNHGMQRTGGELDFVDAGLNYRMTNFQAALGPGQIARFRQQLAQRATLAQQYRARLAGEELLRLPTAVDGHAWQTFMVVLDQRVNRASLRSAMFDRGIETNLGAQALNGLTYFQRKYGWTAETCPVAAELFTRGLALPLHAKLHESDVDHVCDALLEVLKESTGTMRTQGRA